MSSVQLSAQVICMHSMLSASPFGKSQADWMQEIHAGVLSCPAWHESEQFSDLHFRNSLRDNFLFCRFWLFFWPAVTSEKNKNKANNFIFGNWEDRNANVLMYMEENNKYLTKSGPPNKHSSKIRIIETNNGSTSYGSRQTISIYNWESKCQDLQCPSSLDSDSQIHYGLEFMALGPQKV